MSDERVKNDPWSFGDRLARMQEFSAERAAKYRVEIESLLSHRMSRTDRWALGAAALLIGPALVFFGIACATSTPHEESAAFGQARVILGIACAATGLGLGGWLLYIAIKGSYERRLGDIMGILIAVIFGSGWGLSLAWIAFDTKDNSMREKLILASGAIFALMAGCLVLAILQWMHRETQKRLVKIEYYLAEVLDLRK